MTNNANKKTVWVVPDCDALVHGNESVTARIFRLHSRVLDAKKQFPEGFVLVLTQEAVDTLFPGEAMQYVCDLLDVPVRVRRKEDKEDKDGNEAPQAVH